MMPSSPDTVPKNGTWAGFITSIAIGFVVFLFVLLILNVTLMYLE